MSKNLSLEDATKVISVYWLRDNEEFIEIIEEYLFKEPVNFDESQLNHTLTHFGISLKFYPLLNSDYKLSKNDIQSLIKIFINSELIANQTLDPEFIWEVLMEMQTKFPHFASVIEDKINVKISLQTKLSVDAFLTQLMIDSSTTQGSYVYWL